MKRRDFTKIMATAGAGALLPWQRLHAISAMPGLSDPGLQPKFTSPVPDAMAPGFIFQPQRNGEYSVTLGRTRQLTGLVNARGRQLRTSVWGYGDTKDQIFTWPGRTFQVKSVSAGGPDETIVNWINDLAPRGPHLLPVDTSMHWCYSLPGYLQYTIDQNGIPCITHLHGGHTDYQFDGNPEFFYGPRGGRAQVVGPQWDHVPGGFTTRFRYDNDVRAGNLWYHDHALGITRLNVYAGLAGFYFVRDEFDTGEADNPLGLPAWPYEKAYAFQCRMFRDDGELFYPAFPGDPFYDGFITGEGAVLPPDLFPEGGPTGLAEFFGDHMVVNGVIWPYENVEPRNYRMRLLNGTDSRFLALRFRLVGNAAANPTELSLDHPKLPFTVIGSDQGLASSPTTVDTLLFEPGSRYDIVVDFSEVPFGSRVIMENVAGDAPFGGDLFADLDADGIAQAEADGDFFPNRQTDRVMAFDVVLPLDTAVANATPTGIAFGASVPSAVDRYRKVALFEGTDEFGRLQPLLGTAEPATDCDGNPINWPDTPAYVDAGLVGPMEGSIAWHSPTTENPALDTTEEWEIWNMTGDAHPVHLHLVNFEVLGRQEIHWDSATTEDDRVIPDEDEDLTPNDDGVYLDTQAVVQHNGKTGDGFKIIFPSNPDEAYGDPVSQPEGYVENTPKDMVTALPGQITRIRAHFDKPGRYVWHCHILSHEDHEMMRVLHVGPGA